MLREMLAAAIRLVRSPVAAYNAILTEKPYPLVRRIVLLGLTPLYALISISTGLVTGPYKYVLVALTPFMVLLEWIFRAAFLTAIAHLFGSKAPFRINLLVYGYAQSPYLLAIPALLLPIKFLSFLILFLNGWSMLFLYIGLALAHGLSRNRTLLVLLVSQFLPLLVLAGLATLGA